MLGLIRSKGVARFASGHAKLVLGARAASTVGGALDEAVDRLPHKEAVRFVKQDLRWSYQELNKFVNDLANGLQDLHFQKGDVLAVWLPNNAENLVTQFAAAKAGLTVALIDPKISTAAEIEHILKDSKASGIVFEPKISGRNQTKVIQQLMPELATHENNQEVFRPKNFRNLHTVISTGDDWTDGTIPYQSIFLNSPEPHVMERVKKTLSEKTPLAFTYSKVEGQNPKKSDVLTHGDFLKRAAELAKTLQLKNTDKVCFTEYEHGLSFAPLAAVEKNSLLVVPSEEPCEESLKKALSVEPCNIVGHGVSAFKRV
ncbi:TPA: hypothetical protein N0F65_008622 [Lagenidium giganteum]|uniref:AMP-dependent synthetase/ligase domain-containing protein n=1 Tax=Lagenidium giganteum TaxID=4803 RepID=A0AAV2Z2C4_9STRA|nr:TPA: hypothetical protein N0F65_008622 [Lagenidium giganteum]